MKKQNILLISIIIILFISLIVTIIYYHKDKNLTIEAKVLVSGSNYLLVESTDEIDYIIKTDSSNYQEGDKLEIQLTGINKNKTSYEGVAKNIKIIEDNQETTENNNINEITNNFNNNENQTNNNQIQTPSSQENISQKEKYTEEDIIAYFENLDNDLTTYNNSDEVLGKTIKSKFVKCIDFIFYDEEIGGKTFSELTNTVKLKIISIALSIDSKIDTHFPGYKDSINNTYQNIKYSLIEKYLEITTTICNNDENLCQTAKEGFSNLKTNFGITWDLVKDLASSGVSKLKDWYEIWRYN